MGDRLFVRVEDAPEVSLLARLNLAAANALTPYKHPSASPSRQLSTCYAASNWQISQNSVRAEKSLKHLPVLFSFQKTAGGVLLPKSSTASEKFLLGEVSTERGPGSCSGGGPDL